MVHKNVSKSIMSEFNEKFFPHLGRRAETFAFMVEFLIARHTKRGYTVIVETGMARKKNNWTDGQSTVIWDWLLNKIEGTALSIDINQEVVADATKLLGKNSKIQLWAGDSVQTLDKAKIWLRQCDLLYLDSLDLNRSAPHHSPIHHFMELACAWSVIPEGSLIVVDDCIDSTTGKHILIQSFMTKLGIDPVFTGHQTGWIKP